MNKIILWIFSGIMALCVGALIYFSQVFLNLDNEYTSGILLALLVALGLVGLVVLMVIAKSEIHPRRFRQMAWIEMASFVAFLVLGFFAMNKSNQFFNVATNSDKIMNGLVAQGNELDTMVESYNKYVNTWRGWRDEHIRICNESPNKESLLDSLYCCGGDSLTERTFKEESDKILKFSDPILIDTTSRKIKQLITDYFDIWYLNMSESIEGKIMPIEETLTAKLDSISRNKHFNQVPMESTWHANRVGKPDVEAYYTTPVPLTWQTVLAILLLCSVIILPYIFTSRSITNNGPFVEAFRKRTS